MPRIDSNFVDDAVRKIDARTPADRDRALDGYRALAILGVVLGHWLVGSLFLRETGELTVNSPLGRMEYLAPASWFLQMLGLFFLVGGYSAARSAERARARGQSYGNWLRTRYRRLCIPVLVAAAFSVGILAVLAFLGVEYMTLRTWVVLFVQPLWFIAIYIVLTALTLAALWLGRRLGGWAALGMLAMVAVVDLLRYGPWQDSMPDWLGLLNLVPGWMFAYQIGVCWAQGKFTRAGGWLWFVGGALLFAALTLRFDYPWSMVGTPGESRGNAHPPSLLVVALAATQSGAAILLRDRIGRLLRRPRLWAAVVVLNLCALTIFCWHQVPNLLVSIASTPAGRVPGLTDLPAEPSWVLARVGWVLLFGLILIGLVVLLSRYEMTRPATGARSIRVPSGPGAEAQMATSSPSAKKVRVSPTANASGSVPLAVSSINEPQVSEPTPEMVPEANKSPDRDREPLTVQ